MKKLIILLGLSCLLKTGQAQNPIIADSLQLQRASIQDTFLLRVIPEYIQFRLTKTPESFFAKLGVINVIIPRVRSSNAISYRIRTEYDNYYLLNLWKNNPPLFYTQINGRYIVVCDEWTGQLTPISSSSKQRAIAEFGKAGWLNLISDPVDGVFETHSAIYTWRPKN
ncbi:hypothetical protein [Spirosoma aerolatum]|uniref:hypothetical protein n=1 Tax=Spirosoma aerolatum TaxID=1211326 RepID=UPI0009ACD3E8|nr:hypothetical protein [Spirosoma aerolatum]